MVQNLFISSVRIFIHFFVRLMKSKRFFFLLLHNIKSKWIKLEIQKKAGLRTLNEMVASQTAFMVWKSYKAKDCLGRTLFPKRSISRTTRSINCLKATQPVPGNNTLAANLMGRAWNSSTELKTVTTIGAAKSVAWKWACNLIVYYCLIVFDKNLESWMTIQM